MVPLLRTFVLQSHKKLDRPTNSCVMLSPQSSRDQNKQKDSRLKLIALMANPLFLFGTMQEYYQEVNAANYLSRVRVPLMVVNAKDDPFIEGGTLPAQETVQDAPVRLVYHNYGGHCGCVNQLDFMKRYLRRLDSVSRDIFSSMVASTRSVCVRGRFWCVCVLC